MPAARRSLNFRRLIFSLNHAPVSFIELSGAPMRPAIPVKTSRSFSISTTRSSTKWTERIALVRMAHPKKQVDGMRGTSQVVLEISFQGAAHRLTPMAFGRALIAAARRGYAGSRL